MFKTSLLQVSIAALGVLKDEVGIFLNMIGGRFLFYKSEQRPTLILNFWTAATEAANVNNCLATMSSEYLAKTFPRRRKRS